VTYQNPVVKPTHWGYRGWWLAVGGIEWCLPVEEHGLNEYRPWSATVSGASITVSDHEDRTGLDVAVTISLDAAHSYVTIQPRVTNSTGSPQKIQFWLNAMLALNRNRTTDSTRLLLPSSQVTLHSTGQDGLPEPGSKLDWPVFRGRDLSRYANWRGYLGFFASPAAGGDWAGVYDTSNDQASCACFRQEWRAASNSLAAKELTRPRGPTTAARTWNCGAVAPTFWDDTTIQPARRLAGPSAGIP